MLPALDLEPALLYCRLRLGSGFGLAPCLDFALARFALTFARRGLALPFPRLGLAPPFVLGLGLPFPFLGLGLAALAVAASS